MRVIKFATLLVYLLVAPLSLAFVDEVEDVENFVEDAGDLVEDTVEGLGTGFALNFAIRALTGKSISTHMSNPFRRLGVSKEIADALTCGVGVATGNPMFCTKYH